MKRIIATIIILSMFLTTMLAGCSYTVTVAESDDGNATVDIKEAKNVELESVYKISKKPEDFAITDRDYLIIVNDDNEYDFDGEYNKALQKDLVFIPNVVDGDVMAVEKATYLAFTLLQRDLLENDGIEIGLYDGYRTAEDQQYLLDVYAEGSNPNVVKGDEIGYSEHHTGLLLDVVSQTFGRDELLIIDCLGKELAVGAVVLVVVLGFNKSLCHNKISFNN